MCKLCKLDSGLKIKKLSILKSRRGDGYIDVVVAVLVCMMLIVLLLNVISFYKIKQDLDFYAKEMIAVACAEGTTMNAEVDNRSEELIRQLGIDPDYKWKAEYLNPTNRFHVQLDNPIAITLIYRTYIQGAGIIKIPVTLHVTHSGLSEKYWK